MQGEKRNREVSQRVTEDVKVKSPVVGEPRRLSAVEQARFYTGRLILKAEEVRYVKAGGWDKVQKEDKGKEYPW